MQLVNGTLSACTPDDDDHDYGDNNADDNHQALYVDHGKIGSTRIKHRRPPKDWAHMHQAL